MCLTSIFLFAESTEEMVIDHFNTQEIINNDHASIQKRRTMDEDIIFQRIQGLDDKCNRLTARVEWMGMDERLSKKRKVEENHEVP